MEEPISLLRFRLSKNAYVTQDHDCNMNFELKYSRFFRNISHDSIDNSPALTPQALS